MKLGKSIQNESIAYVITDKIKILGVFFKNNVSAQNIEDNWTGRLEKIKNLIKMWSRRYLSIHGKIVIVKSFLISQLVFIMQSIGLPEKILSEINRILYKFIWQRKFSNKKAFEKVKRKVMEGEVNEGGLKMVNVIDLQSCFYLQWIGRLYRSGDENWSFIPKWYFQSVANGNNIFDVNCRPTESNIIKSIKSEFWQKVICTYLEGKTLYTMEEINAEILKTNFFGTTD